MRQRSDISIRQLEYLVAVADTLNFHRAAQKCHVSQPSLSAQVQLIEHVLGVQVFERTKRKVWITDAGGHIIDHARAVLKQVDELLRTSEQNADPFARQIEMGVIPTVAPYLLPEVVPGIQKAFAKLRLVLTEQKTELILENLKSGALDAGILAWVPEVDDFAFSEVLRDPFLAALPKGHVLAKKKRLSLSDLEDQEVLLLDDGHCFRDQALSLCTRVHAKESDVRATSLSTLTQMVSSGLGITLLPSIAVAVENRRAQLDIRPFVAPAPSRLLVLAWRKHAAVEPVLKKIAERMRAVCPAVHR